ncbi:MAG: tetratricopeptide repeat protein [Candidatus Thorarchaeota archaeon]
MKPLGTITMYFPFLEEETSATLESLMQTSLNYSDFLDRLADRILEEDSSPMLVFYAIFHLDRNSRQSTLEAIYQKYEKLDIVQPFILRSKLSVEEATTMDVLQSAEDVAMRTQNAWVNFEMQYLRFVCASTHSVGSAVEDDALKKMQSLIGKTPEMECFSPFVLTAKATRFYNEGKVAEALDIWKQIAAQYLSCNDLVGLSNTHLFLAYLVRNSDSKEAHNSLDKMKEIRKTLGLDVEEEWGYNNIRGSVHTARGEYDLSLQRVEAAIQLKESQRLHTSFRFLPAVMSFLYAELEDGENALEWAKMAMTTPQFITPEPIYAATVYTRMARALTILGEIEQAEKYLEQSEKNALKIGSDSAVAENHIVAGYIERAKENLEEAMYQFDRGLLIALQIPYQNRINSCLVGLVKTEIEMIEFDDATSSLEDSGPWMQRLQRLQMEVDSKDLPGIRGRLMLLKAEFRLKQRRADEADDLLKEVQSMARNLGLPSLDQKALELRTMIESKYGI